MLLIVLQVRHVRALPQVKWYDGLRRLGHFSTWSSVTSIKYGISLPRANANEVQAQAVKVMISKALSYGHQLPWYIMHFTNDVCLSKLWANVHISAS